MKKIALCFFVTLCILSVCACHPIAADDKTEICALVKELKDSVIVVDAVEFVAVEDTERVAELGLTDLDMPNGYYIHNVEMKLEEYTLTSETVYNFIDWKNDFVQEGENRAFSTTKKEEFQKYLNTYENAQPKMPFFVEIIGDKVICITEKPMM